MAGPFDDELTPDEENLLKTDQSLPPAEDDANDAQAGIDQAIEESKPATPPKPADPAAQDPAAPPAPASTDPAAPSPAEVDEEAKALAEFLEKHKDKSPEDLARIALQQSKRANRAEQSQRQVRESVNQLAERARQAAARREELSKAAPNVREAFKKRLAEDPDGAVEALFNGMLDSRLNEADAEARSAQIDQAIVVADEHIPNFGKVWPEMHGLANELGYSDDEINQIDDPRALITLSLANYSARLLKAGVMDRFGNLVNVPQFQPQPVDPRLAAPEPQRTLTGGARSARSNASVTDQLQDILAMNESQLSEFDAANPGVIENLLKQAA